MKQLKTSDSRPISTSLHDWHPRPAGSEGYGKAEVTAGGGGQHGLSGAAHQLLVAQPVLDQLCDGHDLEVVAAGEGDQVRHAGHGAVVVHDLADHAGRVQPGEPRDVDRRLGMAGADKHAAMARHQRAP